MIFKQYYLGCLAHASYLIGDPSTGDAVVVDPQRDTDEYLRDAAAQKLRINHVILTHFHADFISGHLELRRRTGAEIYLGAKAKAAYAFSPLKDGAELSLGKVRLRALETPGHTPEAICVLAFDGGDAPKLVLTGDTLFIGDVGRPDLMSSVGSSAKVLAGQLYESLHKKLMTLPDETLVYPAHGAGSLCGKNLSSETSSTIGQQKKFNYALAPMSKAKFIELVTADQPEAPAYFARDAKLNRSARPTLDESMAKGMKPLTLKQVLAAQKKGAVVLDSRDPADFAAGHLPGSINVGLGGKFATFAGMLLPQDKSLIIVAEPGKERESALRLGRVGFDGLSGYLDGGLGAAHAAGAELASFPRLSAKQLAAALSGEKAAPAVLDVRNPTERKASAIPGSLHIPLANLEARLKEVPRGPLVVTCAGGYRSAMAVSLLLRRGRTELCDLDGGMNAWNELHEAAAAPSCPSGK